MASKQIPTLDGTDIISTGTSYFRIRKAAALLECTADDLLHLGATGNAEIMAPVVSPGIFEWSIGMDGIGPNKTEHSIRRTFDATDRIILTMDDLAVVEAIGWVVPSFLYSIPLAREITKDSHPYCKQSLDLKSDSIAPSEISPQTLWQVANPYEQDAERTTIDHLFISKKELGRLVNGQPLDSAALARKKKVNEKNSEATNGHTERYASVHESILKAAIYCKNKWPAQCGEFNRTWAQLIDDKAPLFWSKEGKPPLSRDRMERLLGEALKLPTNA